MKSEPKKEPLYFEVTDYKSPHYRHIFKFNSAVLGGILLCVGDSKKKFSAAQIKPIENELIINYVHPINGNCNHSFLKSELKRASYQYWRKCDLKPTINFKPIPYKKSKPS